MTTPEPDLVKLARECGGEVSYFEFKTRAYVVFNEQTLEAFAAALRADVPALPPASEAPTPSAAVSEYPPLPESGYVLGREAEDVYSEDRLLYETAYTADDMRAYIDTDRAARASAGVVQVCPECDIADCRHIRAAQKKEK